jgi:hypothetical protein
MSGTSSSREALCKIGEFGVGMAAGVDAAYKAA